MEKAEKSPLARAITDFVSNATVICEEVLGVLVMFFIAIQKH